MKDLLGLTTAEDCRQLANQLKKEQKIIALWATQYPRSTVKLMLYFYTLLRKRGRTCLLLIRHNSNTDHTDISEKLKGEHIYYFNNVKLLEHCPFITALFTHDYCCQGAIPASFPGKIYFFPHNIWAKIPRNYTDLQADGLISPVSSYNSSLDLSQIPNSMKRNPSGNLLIIPAGYPKLDLLLEERRHIARTRKSLVFYPQILDIKQAGDNAFGGTELVAFLHTFFERYPDWEFIIRPYSRDRKHPIIDKLEKTFSNKPFFVDRGDDNDYYLTRATIFMTDMSAAHKNYSYMALRPAIFFRPDLTLSPEETATNKGRFTDIQSFRLGFTTSSELTRCPFGYITTTASAALTAMEEILSHPQEWEKSLRQQRNMNLCHPGSSFNYLCAHMDALLEGRREDGWFSLPKQNAPFARTRDWLLFFSRFALANFPNQMPPFLQEAQTVCGKDPRIPLAALRAYVREWHNQAHIATLHKSLMMVRLQHALKLTPAAWGIRLLRHIQDHLGPNPCAQSCLVRLLQTVESEQDIKQEIHNRLTSMLYEPQDGALASQTAYLMLLSGMTEHAIKKIQDLLPEAHLAIAECRPAIGMYLLKENNIQKLKNLLLQWDKNPVLPQIPGRDILLSWIQLYEKDQDPPCFFLAPSEESSFHIILYAVPLYFKSIEHAQLCLEAALPALFAEAEKNPRLWTQTLTAARLCRRPTEVAKCIKEMAKRNIRIPAENCDI